MAGWLISYGSPDVGMDTFTFGNANSEAANFSWSNVTIDKWLTEQVLDPSGVVAITTKHIIQGSAIISRDNADNFQTTINNCRKILGRRGKGLKIQFPAPDSSELINTLDGTDEDEMLETPFVEFSVDELHGKITAMVSFMITYHDREDVGEEASSGDPNYAVMSHTWSQEFDIRENGLTMYTVSGLITVRQDVTAEDGSTIRLGPNPDRYRHLVFPQIPTGFIISGERWIIDEPRKQLAYTIAMEETARAMPGPAKTGEGTFTWSRTIAGTGAAGNKLFNVTLEGDANTSPTSLLVSAMNMAKTRIDFLREQIQVQEVSEEDITKKNRITYKVLTLGTGGAAKDPIPTGFNLLQDFTVDVPDYEPPNAYGDTAIRAVRWSLFSASTGYLDAISGSADDTHITNKDFPEARTEEANTALEAYQVPDSVFENFTYPIERGSESESMQAAHDDNPYIEATAVERLRVVAHMDELKSQSLNGASIPYQFEKPDVYLQSRYVVFRHGATPDEFQLKPPRGTVQVWHDYNVVPGPVDGNNNRTYAGVYDRILKIIDGSASSGFWINQAVSAGDTSLVFRQFVAPDRSMARPFDPKVEPNLTPTRTVFDGSIGGIGNEQEFPVFALDFPSYYNV